jgi:hypothetical protein
LAATVPTWTQSLDEVRTRFGSIEGYFADGLGMDRDAQAELRAVLTEPDRS